MPITWRNHDNFPVQPADIRRILILGHSGFIGSHLEAAFRERFPTIEIVGKSFPGFDLMREGDAEGLVGILDLQTVVVMLSAIKRQLGDSLDSYLQNIQMTVNLCRIMQRCPPRRLIFFSSAAVYGEEIENTSIAETTAVRPTSFYGASKHAAECLFDKVVHAHKQSSLLILRPPVIYGPGDTGHGYGPSGFVKAALNNEAIAIWGDGTEQREFVLVSDAVEVVCRLLLSDFDGVLNIASGRRYSFADVLEVVRRIGPNPVSVTSRPRTKNKVDHGFCNATLIRLLPGFSFVPLEEGVRRVIAAERKE